MWHYLHYWEVCRSTAYMWSPARVPNRGTECNQFKVKYRAWLKRKVLIEFGPLSALRWWCRYFRTTDWEQIVFAIYLLRSTYLESEQEHPYQTASDVDWIIFVRHRIDCNRSTLAGSDSMHSCWTRRGIYDDVQRLNCAMRTLINLHYKVAHFY